MPAARQGRPVGDAVVHFVPVPRPCTTTSQPTAPTQRSLRPQGNPRRQRRNAISRKNPQGHKRLRALRLRLPGNEAFRQTTEVGVVVRQRAWARSPVDADVVTGRGRGRRCFRRARRTVRYSSPRPVQRAPSDRHLRLTHAPFLTVHACGELDSSSSRSPNAAAFSRMNASSDFGGAPPIVWTTSVTVSNSPS